MHQYGAVSVLLFFRTEIICPEPEQAKQTVTDALAVATTAALWVLMAILVPLGVAPEVDAIFRVSMIFFASESLSAALGVVSFCMWEVTTMIALYCTVLVLTANLVMVMYYHELSENYGDTVSTFFDAFIAMYVFLESAGAFAFNICVLICVLCR